MEWPLLLDNSLPYKEKVTLDLTFDNGAKSSEEFDVSPVNGFIFFQTDKPIYRVSEKVRFRILRLNRALSPMNEKVVLKIQVLFSFPSPCITFSNGIIFCPESSNDKG